MSVANTARAGLNWAWEGWTGRQSLTRCPLRPPDRIEFFSDLRELLLERGTRQQGSGQGHRQHSPCSHIAGIMNPGDDSVPADLAAPLQDRLPLRRCQFRQQDRVQHPWRTVSARIAGIAQPVEDRLDARIQSLRPLAPKMRSSPGAEIPGFLFQLPEQFISGEGFGHG